MCRYIAVFIVTLTLLCGCASTPHTYLNKVGNQDLNTLKTFYLVKNISDADGFFEFLQKSFKHLGLKVVVFEETLALERDGYLVSYDYQWETKDHGVRSLVIFKLIFREPETEFPIVKGEIINSSMASYYPSSMVAKLLLTLLPK